MNELHFGDNLDVLRAMAAESVDLIYLDPPFNSNANYNVLYGTKRGGPSKAQSHAFEDTWKWGLDARRALEETAARHIEAGALLDSFYRVFGGTKMMAYLSMMSVRLIEMRRVLRSTGTLYLHCDPTASHYLKLILDSIFSTNQFGAEIIWKRTSAHSDAGQGRRLLGYQHDIIFQYMKSENYVWNQGYHRYDESYTNNTYKFVESETGRRWGSFDISAPGGADPKKRNPHYEFLGITRYWRFSEERMRQLYAEGKIVQTRPGAVPRQKRYLDEMPGVPLQTLWTDIAPIGAKAQERLGYPTQKPLALLERIISLSSNPGDIVLDPFCGCGTAIEASRRLSRRWIGIDVTYLAIHLIEGRLAKAFGESIKREYRLYGRPEDAHDALVLAGRDWLEFQKWAVWTVGGLPKDRPGADGGIDGVIRYHRVGIEQAKIGVVSVKGGMHVGVDAVHKLKSVVQREGAEIGILICVNAPTAAMLREAASEGEVGPPSRRVPKIQIVTIEQLFAANPVNLPGMIDLPEAVPAASIVKSRKNRKRVEGQTEMLFPLPGGFAEQAENFQMNRPIRNVDVEVTRSNFAGKLK